MKLRFIANACAEYVSHGKTLLCDPWLIDGAFGGSWFHWPKLKTRPQDVARADYLYISHVHPDHYCRRTLAAFRRDIPIVILDSSPNFLERNLIADGFTNLIKLKDWETRELGPFRLTMFKPFVGHPFFETEVGNLIDSALMIEAEGKKILNTNDNTPDLDSARLLRERFGTIDVAQLNYNAAGPFPSCFNYEASKKFGAHFEILTRNLKHMADVARILEPKFTQPFAGAYVIGGKHWQKNYNLGTTTQDVAGKYLTAHGLTPLLLAEGQVFDLKGEPPLYEGTSFSVEEIGLVLGDQAYVYEHEPMPDSAELLNKMGAALLNLKRAYERLGKPRLPAIVVQGGDLGLMGVTFENSTGGKLWANMDPRLLNMILDRREHWNNAEIGCHIEFERVPDVYSFDAHMLLSFFHT